MSKYIIQYSLYGENPRYYDALEYNVSFIESGYSDLFEVWIVIGEGVPDSWVTNLKKTKSKIISHKVKLLKKIPYDFFRIYPILANKGQGFFCRDSDSFLSIDEMNSMIRFIDSKYSFHIVRDHPNHLSPIMGGLFGVKSSKYGLLKDTILNNLFKYKYANKSWRDTNTGVRGEQEIFADYVYPLVYRDAYIESNFAVFLNEKRIISKCSIPKMKSFFMGQIDPKYNPVENRDMIDYTNGIRKLYLPYFLFKLFRYRFLYRIYWRIPD